VSTDTIKSFLLPDLGEGLEDALISCWNVQVGDDVELNQTLCSVETAKAQVEIPSPYAGRIVELGGAEGQTLDVGAVLVRIDTSVGSAPLDVASRQPENANGSSHPPVLVGYGTDDELDRSRRSPPVTGGQVDQPLSEPVRPRAAPPVRKLAADLTVDLAKLHPGSGEGGIITRDDVLAAAGETPQEPPHAREDPRSAHGSPGRDYEVIPVRGVQQWMAERMALSRSRIPDSHASVQVDCTNLLLLRERFKAAVSDRGEQVTPFVLTLRLLVIALMHNRIFNSTWVDSPDGPRVHTHNIVNLGFAVATNRGLLVPVIADAQTKTMSELANSVSELIHGAREGTLKPTELQGSTFTVSNYGALGLDDGVPVINYPEAAILGVGSLKPRAVVVDTKEGLEIVPRHTMTLTCAFDHRIVDGAQVAAFLGELRELIESPEMALLDL
jgi:pyruvate dehydrogenase E2 component (dihydrolipoamide acetyltransferase)